MPTMTRERRRNAYEGSCKVCGSSVQVGDGWLYSDTSSSHARSRHRVRGSWPKFVKCDRCHELKAAHKCDLPENRPTPLPTLGVDAIRSGKFRRSIVRFAGSVWNHAVIELVLPTGESEVVARLMPIECEPIGVGDSYLEGIPCFGGKVLTHAAGVEIVRLGEHAADLYADWLLCPRDYE